MKLLEASVTAFILCFREEKNTLYSSKLTSTRYYTSDKFKAAFFFSIYQGSRDIN